MTGEADLLDRGPHRAVDRRRVHRDVHESIGRGGATDEDDVPGQGDHAVDRSDERAGKNGLMERSCRSAHASRGHRQMYKSGARRDECSSAGPVDRLVGAVVGGAEHDLLVGHFGGCARGA